MISLVIGLALGTWLGIVVTYCIMKEGDADGKNSTGNT